MIDAENKIYDTVATAVRTAYGTTYPTLTVYSDYVLSPTSFPCVTLIEADNSTYTPSQDDSLQEHHAVVMFEANVYTDKASGAKSLAKQIANTVDTTMQNMKFTRTMRMQTPNVDTTIYRITMRYEAIIEAPTVDANGNKTYQMYRSRTNQ